MLSCVESLSHVVNSSYSRSVAIVDVSEPRRFP